MTGDSGPAYGLGSRVRRGAVLAALGLAAAWQSPAGAQPWARFAVPDSALDAAVAAARSDYENAWNALLVATLRASDARADSATRLEALARRLPPAETRALGSHIAADALALRARWSPAERRRRVHAAVSESLAVEARTARDWPRADSLFQVALTDYRRLGEKRREAWVLGSLGVVGLLSGRNDRALAWYEEALVARRALGDPRLLGNTLNDLGQTHLQLQRYPEARDYLREAAVVREQSGQMPALGATLGFLGSTLVALGDRDSAELCLERSLALTSAAGDSLRTLVTLVNYGAMLLNGGDAERAIAIYDRAAVIARMREDTERLAIIEDNLGDVLRQRGRFTEALRHQESAATLRADDPPRLGITLSGLGRTLNELGDPDRAQVPLTRALAIADSLGDDALAARALANLASGATIAGDFTSARGHGEHAVRRAVASGDSALVRDATHTLGQVELAAGDGAAAGPWLERALAAAPTASPEQRASMLVNRALAWHLEGRLDDAERGYREAEALAERAGAADLTARILTNLGDVAERRRDFPTAFARYGDALTRIDTLRTRQGGERDAMKSLASRVYVHEAMIHLLGKLDPAMPESGYAARAFEWAERARARVLLDLVAGGDTGRARIVTLAEAQRLLRSDREALLEYSVGDSSTSLWVIRRSGWRLERLPARSALRARIQALRHGLGDPGRADGERVRSQLRALYRTLIEPAEPLLRGIDRLVISADGPLALIPFEALLTRDAQDAREVRGAYLVGRVAVRYVPSASALALERGGGSSGPVVAVGNPRFAPPGAEVRAGTPVALPNTALELDALERLAGAHRCTRLDGERASAGRVLALPSLAGASILHFATHGDVNEAEPDRSGLWLAPDSGSTAPSRLDVADVLRLRLSAGLVTLSACETGLGRVERGEGVLGLQRAFLAAGAHSTLVSLWSVNDRSTATLMEAFYRGALSGGEDRAAALTKAKRALLAKAETASPFYWAPFVLVGDPGGRTK